MLLPHLSKKPFSLVFNKQAKFWTSSTPVGKVRVLGAKTVRKMTLIRTVLEIVQLNLLPTRLS
jgi:hypothetical protein